MESSALSISRRHLLVAGSALTLGRVASAASPALDEKAPSSPAVADSFPAQAPELVEEIVRVAHFDLARVRVLVGQRPALARATWDWGFGDFESALGAASHMGQREIAEVLIAHGARPDLFAAAMLGQLDVVRAFVGASPGVQRVRGPHGISLLAHARAGGERALPVLRYLESLGDADPADPVRPLSEAERAALVGRYRFGPGARDVMVAEIVRGQLAIRRGEGASRSLHHLGERVFCPAGAEAVRIRFSHEVPAATLAVWDPDLVLSARRES